MGFTEGANGPHSNPTVNIITKYFFHDETHSDSCIHCPKREEQNKNDRQKMEKRHNSMTNSPAALVLMCDCRVSVVLEIGLGPETTQGSQSRLGLGGLFPGLVSSRTRRTGDF